MVIDNIKGLLEYLNTEDALLRSEQSRVDAQSGTGIKIGGKLEMLAETREELKGRFPDIS